MGGHICLYIGDQICLAYKLLTDRVVHEVLADQKNISRGGT